MEANIDGREVDFKKGMEDLKKDIEGLKEGRKNSLQVRLPNIEKVVEETHEENKINVNHDFVYSNVELKTHHIPNIDIWKFDGKDSVT